MLILVQAIDSDDDKGFAWHGGKHTRVESHSLEITAIRDGQELRIQAEDRTQYGTGTRGGYPKVVVHRLTIALNKEELQKIIDEAMSANLVSVPGLGEIIEAQEHLAKGILQLKPR